MKGLSSTLGIVFFKGESGYLGNHRMPTHRPWDREKARPKKEGKKAKQKRRQDSSQPQLYFLFFFFFFKVCVFLKQAWWLPVGWDGDPRRWGCVCVCVCVVVHVVAGLSFMLNYWHLCISDMNTQQLSDGSFVSFRFSISASLMNMFNALAQRALSKKAFMAGHAGNSFTLKSIYVYRLYWCNACG